jgi:chemotaxis protein CheX
MDGIEEDLAEVIEDVWNAVLGINAETQFPILGVSGGDHVCARVNIEGDWEGTLLLDCPEELGRLAAGIMFALSPEDATAQDMSDAMGELINVIAGNVRGLYGDQTTISLPDVRSGEGYDRAHEKVVTKLGFSCGEIDFQLMALQKI